MPGNLAETRAFTPAEPEAMYSRQPLEARLAEQVDHPQQIFLRADENGVALGLVSTRVVEHNVTLPTSSDKVYKYTEPGQPDIPKSWYQDQVETVRVQQTPLERGVLMPVVRYAPSATSYETHMVLLWHETPQEGKADTSEPGWKVVFDNVSPSQSVTTQQKIVRDWREAHGLKLDALRSGVVAKPAEGEGETFALVVRENTGNQENTGEKALFSWEYTINEDGKRTTVAGLDGFAARPPLKQFKRVDGDTMEREVAALKKHEFAHVPPQPKAITNF